VGLTKSTVVFISGALLVLASSAAYATVVSRKDFVLIILLVGLSALGLALLASLRVSRVWIWLIGLMLAARIPLFFSAPVLSDDYFRFLWDGRLGALGEDPYAFVPSEVPAEVKEKIDADGKMLGKMNSPGYYSVYPPLQQAIFTGIARLGNGNVAYEILLARLLFVIADLISLWLLVRLIALRQGDPWHALWFILNPLLIWEGVGNLHFEAVSVPFILSAALLYFRYKKPWASLLLFVFGASFKLRPLMLNVLSIQYPRTWLFAGLGVMLVLMPFAFFSSPSLGNFQQSLALYSKSFEFNASVYFLLREIGEWFLGYNPIAWLGPGLQILAVIVMIVVSIRSNSTEMGQVLGRALTIYGVYFFFATTIHPWYLIVPAALGIAAGKVWILVWSFAVFLSYSHYAGNGFNERYEWIAIEYLLVVMAILFESREWKFRYAMLNRYIK
jgi:hypothetical protein